MIRFLLGCLLWGLGWQPRGAVSSSGFSSDHLVPTRERTGLEATIRILSSLLFLLALCAQFLPDEISFLTAPQFHLLAFASAAWALLMLLTPSLPMDSTAISTALWTFAGYLPFFLLGNLSPFVEQDSSNLLTLIGQGGAIGALVVYGILRDIRRESRAE
mgnify:FL=1|jgi:hypothetical protein